MKNPPRRRIQDHATHAPPPLAARLDATLDKISAALLLPDAVEKVHEARKALKAYRALLRLIPTGDAKVQRRSAAAIARNLSGDRDRQAARDALDILHAKGLLADEDRAHAREALAREPGSASTLNEHIRRLRLWLKAARKIHARVLDRQAAEVDLTASLARAYRQARRSRTFDTPEAMHDLRKRVVTHRYQMSFFSDLTGHGARRVARAQHLRDVLGTIQDTETLLGMLTGGALPDGDLRERISSAGRSLQADLADEARVLHGALFHRRTRDFGSRLRQQMAKAAKKSGAKPLQEGAS